MKFFCNVCGQEHSYDDLAWHFREPLPWWKATDFEREQSTLTPDQCELFLAGSMHYFIHGLLEIPVIGRPKPFVWGVWCSLSEASNLEVAATWEDPRRSEYGPYFGWFCNRLPGYPDSLHLKSHVHQRKPGLRPLVELEETNHPLSVDQRRGIEPERLQGILETLRHGNETGQ